MISHPTKYQAMYEVGRPDSTIPPKRAIYSFDASNDAVAKAEAIKYGEKQLTGLCIPRNSVTLLSLIKRKEILEEKVIIE